MFDFRNRRPAAASSSPELAPPSDEELTGWIAGLGETPEQEEPARPRAGRPYAAAGVR